MEYTVIVEYSDMFDVEADSEEEAAEKAVGFAKATAAIADYETTVTKNL